ncbi:MAG: response regulator [Bacteroidetes bacterium]|nr:response regulator [Bacteroidota bacterium]
MKFKSALVIDDDQDLSMLLKAILASYIPSVSCAFTLSAGIQRVNEMKPDIIFLDNNLPDGQGINFITEIKSIAPQTALVMITAMGHAQDTALGFGADIFIEKPLTSANIYETLNKLAANQNSKA